MEILRKIQMRMTIRGTRPEEIEDRITSCLCSTTSIGPRMETTRNVFRILSEMVRDGLGEEEKMVRNAKIQT